MILKVKAAIKDHPRDWDRQLTPIPDFDVKTYQQQLDRIAGKTSTGEPVLKLLWGGDTQEPVLNGKDVDGNYVGDTPLPKFYFLRPNPITLRGERIPVRRWIIAQNSEPSQFLTQATPEQVAAYRQGFYTLLVVIGDHSNCPPNCNDKKLCYGDYKQPSEAELSWVREATYFVRNLAKRVDPTKPVTTDELERFATDLQTEQEQIEQKDAEFRTDFAKDYWSAHKHRITSEDPSVLKNGRFHFIDKRKWKTS